jgi:hypothetical protein
MAKQNPEEIDASLLRATSKISVEFLVERVQRGKMIQVPSLGVSFDKDDLSGNNIDLLGKTNLGLAKPSPL